MEKSNNTSTGVGFLGLLGIVFITLKLCHVITWSWWLVLLPLWVPIVIGIGGLLIVAYCYAIQLKRNHERYDRRGKEKDAL